MKQNHNAMVATPSHDEVFVDRIIKTCLDNTDIRAALRRADNPETEYQSWGVLAYASVNLDSDNDRLSHALVAADIARTGAQKTASSVSLGQALARCYSERSRDAQAQAKLRRILACQSIPELVRILRPILRFIASRNAGPLDYASLLRDLRSFGSDKGRERVKIKWAKAFYGSLAKGDDDAD